MKRDPYELVDLPEGRYVEFVRDVREHDTERFDRLAYAARILRLLAPRDMTVVICPGKDSLTVREGREHVPGRPPRWAMVSIPPDASRAHIALSLARLTGRLEEPYLVDVLTRAPALRG